MNLHTSSLVPWFSDHRIELHLLFPCQDVRDPGQQRVLRTTLLSMCHVKSSVLRYIYLELDRDAAPAAFAPFLSSSPLS